MDTATITSILSSLSDKLDHRKTTEEWVPSTVSDDALDIPYVPFSKSDRVGRIADWMSSDSSSYSKSNKGQKDHKNPYGQSFGSGYPSPFAYYHEEEGGHFSVASTHKKPAVRFPNKNIHKTPYQQQRNRPGTNFPQRRRFGNFRDSDKGHLKDSSVTVKADWKLVEEIEFSRLNKLHFDMPEATLLGSHGSLSYFDKSLDRLTCKTEKIIPPSDRIFSSVTTSDDPVIQRLSIERTGQVFATDVILSILMAAPRSGNPWDIIIRRTPDALIFDRRDSSQFDLLTVNETASEPPLESDRGDPLNSAHALAIESTLVNHSFASSSTKEGEKYEFDNPSPFEIAEDSGMSWAPAYLYRQFALNDSLDLIARCELDAVMKYQDQDAFITLRALNEFESKGANMDWRHKLDSQRGSVLATELRNNANKLARWTYQALLAGADFIKLGFVSRANFKDRTKHVLLGTSQYPPFEFACQMNVNPATGFGIVKGIAELCWTLTPGNYVLMKDPNKPLLRLYACPESFAELRKDGHSGQDH